MTYSRVRGLILSFGLSRVPFIDIVLRILMIVNCRWCRQKWTTVKIVMNNFVWSSSWSSSCIVISSSSSWWLSNYWCSSCIVNWSSSWSSSCSCIVNWSNSLWFSASITCICNILRLKSYVGSTS